MALGGVPSIAESRGQRRNRKGRDALLPLETLLFILLFKDPDDLPRALAESEG